MKISTTRASLPDLHIQFDVVNLILNRKIE